MKMPKINREEYEVLKGLDDKWKWIVRDEDLEVYETKPFKINIKECFWDIRAVKDEWRVVYSDLFHFIKSEDTEPYSIPELIKEYEKESEGTEVKKDIEWLKRSIGDIIDYYYEYPLINGHTQGMINEIKTVMEQAGEPETLSQEWVEDNFFEVENWDDEVFISDGETAIDGTPQIKVIALQDLKKVVNITRKLPTIPQFVADFIKKNKERLNVYGALIEIQSSEEGKMWEWVFYNHNQDEFAEAWLAYPNIEVEKEKKYEVKDKDDCFLLTKNSEGEVINAYSKVVYKNKEQLTEQEIKDYDERFWPFAVPVEEEEE